VSLRFLEFIKPGQPIQPIKLVESDRIRVGMSSYDVDFNDHGGRITLDVTQQGMNVAELVYEGNEVVWIHVEPWFRKQGLGSAMVDYLRGRGYPVVMPDARTGDGKGFFQAMSQRGKLDEIESIGDLDDSDNDHETRQMRLQPGAKPVARFADVDVYQDNPRHFEFFQGERPVGFAHCQTGPHPDLGEWISVSHIWLDPSVRQKGFGTQFYEWLLSKNLVLISDTHQSDTVQIVWEKLVRKYEAAILHDGAVAQMITKYSDISDAYDVYSDEDETEVTIAVFPKQRTTPLLSESEGYTNPDVDKRRATMRRDPVRKGMYVMYRACPSSVTSFSPMDYVTLNRKFAVGHAQHMIAVEEEPYHVIRRMVDQDDRRPVLFDAPNTGEYFYDGPPLPGKIMAVPMDESLSETNHILRTSNVSEAFDTPPAHFSIHHMGPHDAVYHFDANGMEFEVEFMYQTTDDGWGSVQPRWEVLYGPTEGGDHKWGATGKGGAQEILSSVIAVVKDFVERNPKAQVLRFSAGGTSHVRLYSTMVPYLAKRLNFDYSQEETQYGDYEWLVYPHESLHETVQYSDTMLEQLFAAIYRDRTFARETSTSIDKFAQRLEDEYIDYVPPMVWWEPGHPDITSTPEWWDGFRVWLEKRYRYVVRNIQAEIGGYPAQVMREMNVTAQWNPTKHGLGLYWATPGADIHAFSGNEGPEYQTVHLTAEIQESDINWFDTIRSRLDFFNGDEEQEIQLKPGVMIKLVEIDDTLYTHGSQGFRLNVQPGVYPSNTNTTVYESLSSVPTHTPKQIAVKHGVDVSVITKQLTKGIKVEHEHTTSPSEARQIALDHLWELPDYYDRLGSMERQAGLTETLDTIAPIDYHLVSKDDKHHEYEFTYNNSTFAVMFSNQSVHETRVAEFIFVDQDSLKPSNRWTVGMISRSRDDITRTYTGAIAVFSATLHIVLDFMKHNRGSIVDFTGSGVRGRLYATIIPKLIKTTNLRHKVSNHGDAHTVTLSEGKVVNEGPAVPLRVTPTMVKRAADNKCQIIVEMPIQQFLDISTGDKADQQRIMQNAHSVIDYNRWAKMGHDRATADRFNAMWQKQHEQDYYEPYEKVYGNDLMPWLTIQLDADGSMGKVVGHEGRHRGSAAMRAGAKTMQVALRVRAGEDMFPDQYSPDYFITQEHLPKYLVGQYNKDVYPTGGWKIIEGDLQKRTRERFAK
jgi:hypothetical protein